MTVLSSLALPGIVAGILVSIEAGHQIGLRRWASVPAGARTVSPTIEASVFGLMGLLITFTFYGAGARFDTRRNLIAEEANMIGTAYLRLDLLSPQAQPVLRDDFREYLRSRLVVYRAVPDIKAVKAALDRSAALQNKVWNEAVEELWSSGKDAGPVFSECNDRYHDDQDCGVDHTSTGRGLRTAGPDRSRFIRSCRLHHVHLRNSRLGIYRRFRTGGRRRAVRDSRLRISEDRAGTY